MKFDCLCSLNIALAFLLFGLGIFQSIQSNIFLATVDFALAGCNVFFGMLRSSDG